MEREGVGEEGKGSGWGTMGRGVVREREGRGEVGGGKREGVGAGKGWRRRGKGGKGWGRRGWEGKDGEGGHKGKSGGEEEQVIQAMHDDHFPSNAMNFLSNFYCILT